MQLFKRSRKIDFIIGGTQKGGTTALDHYLRNHPQIGMAIKKEVHFFDNEKTFSSPDFSFSDYDKSFDFKLNRKIYGEATPIYLYWKPSCKRIWEYNPNIKLIFILRNPIERAFSHWNMQVDRNIETESFGYAIRNESNRIKESLPLQNRFFSYIDRGLYAKQIERFLRFFPHDQLLFIKYDDFYKDQEQTLFKIFHFLGVNSTEFTFEHKTIHKRKKHSTLSNEDKKYLISKFENDIKKVENNLGWDCSDWLT